MYDCSFRIDIIERYALLENGKIVPHEETTADDEIVLIGAMADIRAYLQEQLEEE